MKRAVQFFSEEYLAQCRKMKPRDIVEFLEGFRELHGGVSSEAAGSKSKLISLKIQGDLLAAFRRKAELEGVRYQTQIKELMRKWLVE